MESYARVSWQLPFLFPRCSSCCLAYNLSLPLHHRFLTPVLTPLEHHVETTPRQQPQWSGQLNQHGSPFSK